MPPSSSLQIAFFRVHLYIPADLAILVRHRPQQQFQFPSSKDGRRSEPQIKHERAKMHRWLHGGNSTADSLSPHTLHHCHPISDSDAAHSLPSEIVAPVVGLPRRRSCQARVCLRLEWRELVVASHGWLHGGNSTADSLFLHTLHRCHPISDSNAAHSLPSEIVAPVVGLPRRRSCQARVCLRLEWREVVVASFVWVRPCQI
ncbi:hypothetical protein NL676_009190 [Syzygium grande]|nr:hypothetical protein NL676_009190 [Syzygium grande]